jgi:hypothetical protein
VDTAPDFPLCETCRRPLAPYLSKRQPETIPKPQPAGSPGTYGKFVCYSALCNKYGLVLRVDPPSALGGRQQA